ncbi:MAG: recombinase family protein [Bacillota bacterium]
MPVALVYRRVSTEEQRKTGYSLADQLTECRKRAEALGATEIVDIVDDMGGDYLERPQLQRAIELCETGRIRWFLCWDPDRFGRTLLTQQLAAEAISAAGTEIIFINHDYSDTDEGRMFFQMRGVIAEYEKKKILDRTARGKRAKLRAGQMPGWLDPYGYRFNTRTDRLEIDEAEAPWVRQIFAWASDPDPASRLGPAQIAQRLNQLVDGPRGKHWYRSTVRDILRNPLYTGVLYWGKYSHKGVLQARRARLPKRLRPQPRPESQWHRLAVPALVEPGTWRMVQDYLTLDRNRRSPGRLYMLSGLVRCGLCGAGASSKRPRSGRYFCCSRRYPPPGKRVERCMLPHINAEKVEAHVWQTVCRWLTDSSMLEHALSLPGLHPPEEPLRVELAQVQAGLRENEKQQKRLLRFVTRNRILPEVADGQIQALTAQAESLRQRQAELEATLSATVSGIQLNLAAEELLVALSNRLDGLAEERRHDLVRRLVGRVTLAGPEEANWMVEPLSMNVSSHPCGFAGVNTISTS